MRTFIRRLVLTVIVLVVLIISLAWALGFPPAYLFNAPQVATGIGAKLSCSMRYVMGLSEQQAAADIEVYSPILKLLNYRYNDETRSSSAAIGPYVRTASYKENFGCYLDYANSQKRDFLYWPKSSQQHDLANIAWPAGHQVTTTLPLYQSQLKAILDEDNAQGHDTRALLVVHKGNVVAEAYADGFDEHSVFLGWSMAKSFTGLMVGQLQMLGKLNAHEHGLFPQWSDDERSAITIKNLLQMTDGLAYDEIYDPGQTAPAMLFQAPSAAQYMIDLPVRDSIGEYYRYSSGSTVLLNKLVQQRWGQSNAEAVRNLADQFFKPFALYNMTFEADADGLLMGSSYLYATARDWAKLGQLMLNGGEINGKRIVTPEWIAEALEPNTSYNEQYFGMHWWLNRGVGAPRWPSLPENAFAAQGNRDQRVLVLPDQELVIVRLGWSKDKYRDDEVFKTISGWF